MADTIRKLKEAERKQAGFGIGRDPRTPRFWSGQIASEARQAYYGTLPSDFGTSLQNAAGDLIDVDGIDN